MRTTVSINFAVFGGGIKNFRTMTLTDSTVEENSAVSATTDGDGIHNSGRMTLSDSLVTRNAAGETGGGIFNDSGFSGSVRLRGTRVVNNIPNNCAAAGSVPGCTGGTGGGNGGG
ncbi:hypothetical protein [Streptomyces sp. NPDC002573]|uniref:hypothetical protein n=1 Tax=Streptomyces sp. NPDC002573 TaxID=3364651 RepID=UPI00368FB8EE